MRSTVLTLRTVKRDGQNTLAIESSVPSASAPPTLKTIPDSQSHSNSHHDEPIHLTASFHDTRSSGDTVLVDMSQLPGAKEGDVAELQPIDDEIKSKKKLLFIIKQMNNELIRRSKLSVVSNLQSMFNSNSRNPVIIKLKDKTEVEADLIEIMIKDIGLNRGDIWELSSLLTNTCVYKNQKLTFLETIRATVGNIYKMGKKTFSAYVGNNTKIVFRSESARLIFLIQITEEMYHFQEDGEIMFHKVVNSLFPAIFKRWREEETHHLITIVFVANVDFTSSSWNDLKIGERPSNTKDYYRVVVDQINVVHWNEIMISLRTEFSIFRKDIITDQIKKKMDASSRFLPTIKSDILGTINLSTTLVNDKFKDPDLRHTTNHFIVISAGNGLYDVNYDDLLDTGKRQLNSEVSVDIICLAEPPLHLTPLFRYIDHSDNLHHCVPGWVDISYWSENSSRSRRQWLPKCKIYELQMMGIMENDMSSVTVKHLKKPNNEESILELMATYDKDIFNVQKDSVKEQSFKKDTPVQIVPKSLLTPSLPNRSPSLPWKVPNTSISKTEITTASSPIFSNFSKSALSSLKEYSNPTKNSTEKSSDSISSSSSSSIKSSKKNMLGIPLPKLHNFHQKKELTSTSPSSLNSSIVENINTQNFSVIDSLKTTMWTEIDNISQKLDPNDLKKLSVGKWQDVYPQNFQRRLIKWRSLSSPSELPVTTPIFPNINDFNKNFTFQTHSIVLSDENEKFMSPGSLLREMIHLRLMLGFQICHGQKVEKIESKRITESNKSLLIKYLPFNEEELFGSRIYLSLDEEIHRISLNYDGSINVQGYHRNNSKGLNGTQFKGSNITIKTRYQRTYHPYNPDIKLIENQSFNWNKYDQYLAGYIDENEGDEKLQLNRIKFVLLPSEIPKATYLANENKELLSNEEIRVEGLRKLIATIHRNSFRPEIKELRRSKKKEEALPEISFYTGDLIQFLEDQYLDSSNNLKKIESNGNNSTINSLLNIGSSLNNLLNKDIPLFDLYSILKSPKGVKLNDRKWHWKIHKTSFIGLELVTWLVDNFEDINTREEATEFGNYLMENKVLRHVENRHKFLDGYYFYFLIQPEINELNSPTSVSNSQDDLQKTSRSNSVGSGRQSSRFLMTTVTLPENDDVDSLKKIRSENSELSRIQTNTTNIIKEKQTVVLSHSLKYNLDLKRSSYKPEIMTVHYDKVHNPNHCFHIRLEWLTATPKLIDDTINSWARICERYGLILVETPWNEICEIPKLNPFHSYVDIKLCINPWTDPEFHNEDIIQHQKFYYHIYLLEYSGFLMDNRASMFFSNSDDKNLEILYSWGKPSFKYAQYIHRTGAYIAEIRDTGDLYLAPNNTHVSRVNVGNLSSQQKNPSNILDSQKIMLEFRKTCFSDEKLRKVFLKAKEQWNRVQANNSGGRLTPIPDDLLTI